MKRTALALSALFVFGAQSAWAGGDCGFGHSYYSPDQTATVETELQQSTPVDATLDAETEISVEAKIAKAETGGTEVASAYSGT